MLLMFGLSDKRSSTAYKLLLKMSIYQYNAAVLSCAWLAGKVMKTGQNSCLLLPQAEEIPPCSKKIVISTRKVDGGSDNADAGGGGGGGMLVLQWEFMTNNRMLYHGRVMG
jgi:hypothetical protein